jgi:hypothetical protein
MLLLICVFLAAILQRPGDLAALRENFGSVCVSI